MADDPAPKRVRRALGTVCEACEKHYDTSDGFDKHRTRGYLLGTPCHVLNDGSTRAQLVATLRQTMSTAMLQICVKPETRSANAWYSIQNPK